MVFIQVYMIALISLGCARAQQLHVSVPEANHRYNTRQGHAGVNVGLKFDVLGFDLVNEGKVCWSVFRVVNGEDELYSPPSCFGAVQELTIRALPEGSYRILGSLVATSGLIVAHSPPRVFHVLGEFVPSYEWQLVADSQDVPPGLEVTMPMDGSGDKRARIPPVWRLQMDLGDVAGLFRTDVQRGTTVAQIGQAAASHLVARYRSKGVPIPGNTCIAMVKDSRRLEPSATAEEVDWFNSAKSVRAGLQPCDTPAERASFITWDLQQL